ncbi:YfhO family protein [Gaoshiqia sediminis]|uniref:YfhO family protein n=1 Tax=Gaoshiqia sediminis TaxID=2986998 RepID=A0AA41YB42_9BACT|nr:YfhO family protein [Gaoshiqia sediminis]MCW0482695.1 YfhO family protein [Gaoshiqia sediminis]
MAKIKGNRNILAVTGIILFFIITAFLYFSPQLEGKKLDAGDTAHYLGMAKEVNDFRAETGEEALWTNSMFGGMPAYLISVKHGGELLARVQTFYNTLLPRPAGYLVLYCLFFFVLTLLLGVNPFAGAAGALMYGFATFFFVLMGAGHMTKVHTLTYMALVVAGVLMAYRNQPVAGSLVTAIGLSWMLSANHPQMTYYAGIMVVLIGISYLVAAVREKTLPAFLKASGLLLIALVLAVGTNFGRLYTTYEYGKDSIRGASELTTDEDNQTAGLDKNYILDYSYDWGEAMTAFIPRFKGGGMSEPLGEKSEVYRFFEKNQGKAAAKQVTAALPMYWGSQPISSAPFYYGAVLCFLFVLGLFVVKGTDKWWIAAVVVVSFLLSLGKNAAWLSNFMIDYFPGYNKFRDVKNIIVIQHFSMALLGVLAIREIYLQRLDKAILLKKLKHAWFILGGLALLFVVFPGLAGDFTGPTDARLAQAGWPEQLLGALRDDRRMVLRTDAFKALIFISLAAGLIWLYVKQKLKASYALALWVALIFADMWPVNKKYLNDDNFTSKSKAEAPYKASAADQEILKDTDPDYRVLNLTVSLFQDASTSYFHKSLGGYHGAKMERYQELFDHQLFPEVRTLIGGFQKPEAIDSVMRSLSVVNMLNTKYIIYDPNRAPLQNHHALGHAWFVDEVKLVEDANEEIAALAGFDAAEEALVDQRFSEMLKDMQFGGAGESQIELLEYRPNYLKYKARAKNTSLAVFSEIYYPKGWKAYIDGQETDHLRANYVLRALPVPAGEHEIEFRFEPASYFTGNKISLASSLLLILALALVGYSTYKKKAVHEKEVSGKA